MARNQDLIIKGQTNKNNFIASKKYYNNQAPQSASPKYFKSISSSQNNNNNSGGGKAESPSRMSPSSSVTSSPRTSPGLIAGHYAGCKFTEPPLPSALPHPPQHWMQTSKFKHFIVGRPIVLFDKQEPPEQLTNQLKVLLKVHA